MSFKVEIIKNIEDPKINIYYKQRPWGSLFQSELTTEEGITKLAKIIKKAYELGRKEIKNGRC